MEKARIFISYKRKNKDQVFSIVNKIETQLGVKCWVDLYGIESSAQFASKICKAIDTAEVVLFMHSSIHLDIDFEEDWTIDELNYARAKKKKVVLVKLDDAPLENIFLMKHGAKHNIDSRDETQFQMLLKDLRTWLNLPPQTQESDSKTTHSINKKQDASSKIHKIYDEEGNLQYEGEMKNGKRHGQGRFYLVDGDIYEGEFKEGIPNGEGTYYYTNGDKYEGQFVNGKFHGQGTYYFVYGDRYEGQFADHKYHGQGTYYVANGDRYEGQFLNGIRHGQGIHYSVNGTRYEGKFVNGELHGQATCYYANGDKYIGQISMNGKHGQGTYYYANGNRYEGQFVNEKKHGHGIIHYANGTKENVIFDNDILKAQYPLGY